MWVSWMRSYSQERPICGDVVSVLKSCHSLHPWVWNVRIVSLVQMGARHYEGLVRHLAGLAVTDLDLLRGANHDL